jgi:DDE superfamily endonuclease
MEDVLDLYNEPQDAQRPVVCFDECPCQLVQEVRAPEPAQGPKARRVDYEYKRNGTANLFMVVEPKAGWRHVQVTQRRTKMDFAVQMKGLVDTHFPQAEVIRVVLDNLNTHTPAALYEVFPPEEAHRIVSKLEFHYTAKHGSWLNMAELELAALATQCLGRRIGDAETLAAEVGAWEAGRNHAAVCIHWRFTTTQARIKLARLYPTTSTVAGH